MVKTNPEMTSPVLLAVDTALSSCSVAVMKNATIAGMRHQHMVRGQSETLLPMAGAALTDAGLSWADLDVLAVTVGPGAFTGLRIGLSAVRGLGLSLDLPMVGVTTMEAIVHAMPKDRIADNTIWVAVESRREDVYVQCFDQKLQSQSHIKACLPEDLAREIQDRSVTLCGDGQNRVAVALQSTGTSVNACEDVTTPMADHVAMIALEKWQRAMAEGGSSKCREMFQSPAPVYVRPPDAIVPENGGRLRN